MCHSPFCHLTIHVTALKKDKAITLTNGLASSSFFISHVLSAGREISASQRIAKLCSWEVKAGVVLPLVDACGWQVSFLVNTYHTRVP